MNTHRGISNIIAKTKAIFSKCSKTECKEILYSFPLPENSIIINAKSSLTSFNEKIESEEEIITEKQYSYKMALIHEVTEPKSDFASVFISIYSTDYYNIPLFQSVNDYIKIIANIENENNEIEELI